MLELAYKPLLAERMRRVGIAEPLTSPQDEEGYLRRFRLFQPVSPVHNTRPGDPPKLVHRTQFDDYLLSSRLRERHELLKGRFNGGRVGYVLQEDLELYATAFCKPMDKLYRIHEDILALLRNSGGLSKDQLKEELDYYPRSQISKALLVMHEAFLIYEDQLDTDWDTGWLDFATEWFEVPTDEPRRGQAIAEVIRRAVHTMVFATADQIKSWASLPVKTVKQALDTLLAEGKIVTAVVPKLGQGYVCAEDAAADWPQDEPAASIYMLDKSDFLVRMEMKELQARYKGLEALQYLLIDGEFKGVVLGHWGFGPYDVDDIVTDIPAEQAESRRQEILDAVTLIYQPEEHAVRKINGVPLAVGSEW
ncbi:DNA glycosylase AlkZ-like family protein [Gorillibacterium massiliense]|uniref:DNA glycosylase AlkZ-like family protein n=1 Tax=Gorillibacterium massiliense TaxID=1280390 RepID=UPI0004B219A8|nr:crosslink repair DNA glycosylase YcaQ family protein [Gorillibacterium massiliense]